MRINKIVYRGSEVEGAYKDGILVWHPVEFNFFSCDKLFTIAEILAMGASQEAIPFKIEKDIVGMLMAKENNSPSASIEQELPIRGDNEAVNTISLSRIREIEVDLKGLSDIILQNSLSRIRNSTIKLNGGAASILNSSLSRLRSWDVNLNGAGNVETRTPLSRLRYMNTKNEFSTLNLFRSSESVLREVCYGLSSSQRSLFFSGESRIREALLDIFYSINEELRASAGISYDIKRPMLLTSKNIIQSSQALPQEMHLLSDLKQVGKLKSSPSRIKEGYSSAVFYISSSFVSSLPEIFEKEFFLTGMEKNLFEISKAKSVETKYKFVFSENYLLRNSFSKEIVKTYNVSMILLNKLLRCLGSAINTNLIIKAFLINTKISNCETKAQDCKILTNAKRKNYFFSSVAKELQISLNAYFTLKEKLFSVDSKYFMLAFSLLANQNIVFYSSAKENIILNHVLTAEEKLDLLAIPQNNLILFNNIVAIEKNQFLINESLELQLKSFVRSQKINKLKVSDSKLIEALGFFNGEVLVIHDVGISKKLFLQHLIFKAVRVTLKKPNRSKLLKPFGEAWSGCRVYPKTSEAKQLPFEGVSSFNFLDNLQNSFGLKYSFVGTVYSDASFEPYLAPAQAIFYKSLNKTTSESLLKLSEGVIKLDFNQLIRHASQSLLINSDRRNITLEGDFVTNNKIQLDLFKSYTDFNDVICTAIKGEVELLQTHGVMAKTSFLTNTSLISLKSLDTGQINTKENITNSALSFIVIGSYKDIDSFQSSFRNAYKSIMSLGQFYYLPNISSQLAFSILNPIVLGFYQNLLISNCFCTKDSCHLKNFYSLKVAIKETNSFKTKNKLALDHWEYPIPREDGNYLLTQVFQFLPSEGRID